MLQYRSFFKKKLFVAANQSLYRRAFLPVLITVLLASYALPLANQARADDFRDLDTIEALQSKWEKVKKEGLSAGDVKKLTDKLKELAGKDIDGTGVKQLLDSMNANAERLANLKDSGDKLEDMIALVEKYKNLPTGDDFDGEATMEALADTLKYMSDLMEEVPPPFGTIAGPMLKAYSEAVERGAGHVKAIQAATKAKNEAIEGKLPEEPPEDVVESFEWNVYPYRPWCPQCENEWWMAGNSAARASNLESAYGKVKKEADALSDQAKETRDRLVKEGYRESTAEREANNQEVLFEGGKRPLIDAWNSLNRDVQKLKGEFEKADEHAKEMRQMFIACLERCNEQDVSNWSGTWVTRWVGEDDGDTGSTRVTLIHNGTSVTGSYDIEGGQIRGTVRGNTLSGEWWQGEAAGTISWTMSQDSKSFTGTYSGTLSGEDDGVWSGTRQ